MPMAKKLKAPRRQRLKAERADKIARVRRVYGREGAGAGLEGPAEEDRYHFSKRERRLIHAT